MSIVGPKYHLSLDEKSYNIKAVKKCLYWYSDRYSFDIKISDGSINILISKISNNSDDEVTDDLIRMIKSDLIDYEVRLAVEKETHTIRQLLIAKAFAPTDQFENPPPGEISDPVGFKP